jgi:WD40 repeat protein
MMDNLSHQQVQRWLMNRTPLEASRQAAVQRHLQECADCRAFASTLTRLESDLPAALLPEAQRIPSEQHAAQGVRRKLQARQARRRLFSGLRELSYVAAALLLVLGLGYLLRTLLVRPPSTAGETAALRLEVTPTDRPLQPLSLASTPAEVRQRLFAPHWQTLSALGVVTLAPPGGLPTSRYVQVWLDRSGAGRVLISDWMNYAVHFSPDLTPIDRFASDGVQVARYDLSLQGYDPTMQHHTWYQHPLENVSPVTLLLFPGVVDFGSAELQVESEELWGDRPVLVVAWSINRLWLDARSGMLLQWQQTLLDGSTQTARLISYDINPTLPGDTARLDDLEQADFQALESPLSLDAITPMPQPTPGIETAASPEPFNPNQVVLSMVDSNLAPLAGNEVAIMGEVYPLLRQLQAPFRRSLGHVQTACLALLNDCPVEIIPGYPEASDDPLTWSPDGRYGALPVNAFNEVRLYDSVERSWKALLSNVFVPLNLMRWSPDGAWVAVMLSVPGSEDSLLTVVSAESSQARSVAPDLGGMQIPIGWASPNQVIFLHQVLVRKGDVFTSDPPSIYLANIEDGSYSLLPFQGIYDWLKSHPALSPDGTRLALPLAAGMQMQVVALDGTVLASLGTTGFQQSWSPDGQWLALVESQNNINRLVIIPSGGGEMRTIYEYAGPMDYQWTADSRFLLVQTWPAGEAGLEDAGALRLVSLEQGWVRRLQLNAPDGAYELVYPSLSK